MLAVIAILAVFRYGQRVTWDAGAVLLTLLGVIVVLGLTIRAVVFLRVEQESVDVALHDFEAGLATLHSMVAAAHLSDVAQSPLLDPPFEARPVSLGPWRLGYDLALRVGAVDGGSAISVREGSGLQMEREDWERVTLPERLVGEHWNALREGLEAERLRLAYAHATRRRTFLRARPAPIKRARAAWAQHVEVCDALMSRSGQPWPLFSEVVHRPLVRGDCREGDVQPFEPENVR